MSCLKKTRIPSSSRCSPGAGKIAHYRCKFINETFFRKPLIAPKENVMVTYEYQYEIKEDEGDYSDYSDDYDSKGAKKNSKASKNASKRPKNT